MVKPNLQKAVAVFLTVLSAMVVWSECTFFNKSPVLSLFAIFINLAKDNYNFVFIEVRLPPPKEKVGTVVVCILLEAINFIFKS